jgi:hypothetical protein
MSDEERRTNVLLEHLGSQFRAFGEGLDGLRDDFKEFKQEMTGFKNDTIIRLDRIEYKNKLDHTEITQAIHDLNTDVNNLTTEIKRLDTAVVQIKRVK